MQLSQDLYGRTVTSDSKFLHDAQEPSLVYYGQYQLTVKNNKIIYYAMYWLINTIGIIWKWKYQSMDNTKIEIKRGHSYRKKQKDLCMKDTNKPKQHMGT